jgi:hypothetical protein
MTPNCGPIESLVLRMQGDFLDAPELTLTLQGAQHRFGIDESTCEAVLAALVDAGVLARTREGAYTRRLPHLAPRPNARRESRPRPAGTRRIAEHAA